MKLRVVFAGTPAFALPALRALIAAHVVVGVLTQPDRPAGRGRHLTASPVKQTALAHGVSVLQPASLRGGPDAAQVLAQLAAWQPDVVVVVAYGLILPQVLLDLPRLGCLNIHASLLPRWRGAAPIQRAILAGDPETGVSIMRMDAGLDTGPVLCEARRQITAQMTAGDLHDELAALGAEQLLQALENPASSMQATPQSTAGATYAAKLSKSEAPIDWTQSAVHIDRQIRGLNPWPMAETVFKGEPLRILRSALAAPSALIASAPGTLLGLRNNALAVACGQGCVAVLELQRAGRKPVSACDFMNSERAAGDAPLVFG